MTKAIKRDKYQAIVALCIDLLADHDIENGGRTVVEEMIEGDDEGCFASAIAEARKENTP